MFWSLKFPHARGLDVFSPRVDFACLNIKALAALNADYFKWSVYMQLPMDESAWVRLVSFFDVNDDAWASLWLPSPLFYSRHRMTKGRPQVTWQGREVKLWLTSCWPCAVCGRYMKWLIWYCGKVFLVYSINWINIYIYIYIYRAG